MNRPHLPKFVCRSVYTVELEKYCDELEKALDKYSKDSCEYPYHIVDEIKEQLNVTERLVEKLAKALDKACELLTCLDCHDCERVCHIKCDDVRKSDLSCTKEDWKEYLLND